MTGSDIITFPFEGVEVRTVDIDGSPWWVAADVAAVLGIANGRNMVARLDEDEKGVRQMDTRGGRQNLTVINESGLYAAIIRSDSPRAGAFKRWVTHEVLPTIRATGSYDLALPHDYLSALEALVQREKANVALNLENQRLAPRAEAWNAIASAEGDYSVGDAAKMLVRAGIPTGPQRLFQQLADIKWTFRAGDGRWRAYAERVEKGYLAERPQFHYHPGSGERMIDPPQLRITIKGVERLRQRLHVGALQAVTA